MDLKTYVLENVRKRTALIARTKGDATLATTVDDEDVLGSYLDHAIIKTLIHCGILNHDTNVLSGDGQDYGELVPHEQYESLALFVMAKWYLDIGQPVLHQTYLDLSGLPIWEDHRFTKKVAQRPYVM